MKWLSVFVATLGLVAAAGAGASVKGLPGGPNPPQPLTVFAAGSFPESLAVQGGSLYVSLGFAARIEKVTPSGGSVSVSTYADELPIGNGLLTGLAFDGAGNLYVGVASFPTAASDPAPGVFVIPPGGGSFSRVLTLPAGSFPNGLAFKGTQLYVSDSSLGAIWRLQPSGTNVTLSTPWYESALLTPTRGIGANGIAFDNSDHLYAVVSDAGRVVRLTLGGSGNVVTTTVVTEQEQLRSIDGIAFDRSGNLYAAVNDTNRLYRVSLPSGTLTRLADRSDGLSYPTQPAFDSSPGSTILYLTNGAFSNGVADIEAFNVGMSGLPIPQ